MSKTELFEEDLRETAEFFKVLAHPARLAILKYLAESNTCITGDISNELPLSRTTVNQHLDELKKLEVIQGEISGVKVYYCINQEKFEKLWETAQLFIEGINNKNTCCKDDLRN